MYIHPLYHWPPKSQWLGKPSHNHSWSEFSSYVHFPYCRNICDFCGYETRLISKSSAQEYPDLLLKQISRYLSTGDFSSARLKAIFFGGGTASLMSESGLKNILSSLTQLCINENGLEVTLECEPGTISQHKLREAQKNGVNRVSVCAQSFNDQQLKRISRKHSTKDSMNLVDRCQVAGIENIHIDLMYGGACDFLRRKIKSPY